MDTAQAIVLRKKDTLFVAGKRKGPHLAPVKHFRLHPTSLRVGLRPIRLRIGTSA